MRPDHPMGLMAAAGTVVLTVIFGANAVAIKLVLTGMGPLTAAGLRFFLAAAAIALWSLLTGRPFRLQRGQGRQMGIVTAIFCVQLGLFYVGMQHTTASRAVLLSNLLPFFVLFLSHRFIPGEPITARKLAGTALGFIGILILFAGSPGARLAWQPGDAIVLAAVVIWSANVVYTKRIIHDYAPFQLVLYPMLGSAPVFLAAGWLLGDGLVFRLDAVVLGAYLYQGLISAAFGFVAWNALLKRYGAASLHSFVFIMPIAGVLCSAWLLGEPITVDLVAALALIAVGLGVIHIRVRRPILPFPLGRGL